MRRIESIMCDQYIVKQKYMCMCNDCAQYILYISSLDSEPVDVRRTAVRLIGLICVTKFFPLSKEQMFGSECLQTYLIPFRILCYR